MAACLRSLGRSAEALPKFEAALEMQRRLFEGLPAPAGGQAGDHPDVANSLNNVASSLISLGRSEEALPKYEAALQMLRRVLPPGHPHTLYPQLGLARTLISLECYTEAEPLLLDAAEQCAASEAARRMHWRSVAQVMTELYDAWAAAEPQALATDGMPVPQKATEWRAKLEQW